MDALLIATGFTGALTLIYLVRLVFRIFHPPLTISAHFSPGGGCTDVIVREIVAAKEILVLAYGFTSRPIAQALADAKARAVHVEILLDHSNEKDPHSEMPFLLEHKIVPRIDAHHAIAHNKVMLIDGKTLLTGSFNFTQNAESHNAENLVIIKGRPDLVSEYRHDFNHHQAHAREIEGGQAHSDTHAHHPSGAQAGTIDPHDILTAVARGTTATPATDEEEGEGPVTTLPAAEMFNRPRKEAKDHPTRKAA